MTRLRRPWHALLVLLPCALTPRAGAISDAEAAAGREVLQRHAEAIVSVELVAVIKGVGDRSAPPRENKMEANGTVLSPAGLTVTSLGAIDARVAIGRSEVGETEFKEVKLRLADGTEVPARVVLRDADLDLAFIAPAAGETRTFACLQLEDAADAVVLGNYYTVTRVNKALQRAPIVRLSTVIGVVEKPRRLIIVTDQDLGCPVFDARGRTLGISLRYYANGRLSGIIVLPAADVADMAKQAEAARQAAEANPAPAPPAEPPAATEPPATPAR